MSDENKSIAGEIEGDYTRVPVQLAGGLGEKPLRPTPGTQVVFGGKDPSSPWGHLLALIEKAGGSVNYTFVHAAELKASPIVVPADPTAGDALPLGDHPRLKEEDKKAQPAPAEAKKDGPAKQDAPPPEQPVAPQHPVANNHFELGTGPLFDRGQVFKYDGNDARVWADPRTMGPLRRPLLIVLHGVNHKDRKSHPSLSDDSIHVGKLAQKLADDGKVTPLVICAPTSFSNGPWNTIELADLVDTLEKMLADRNVHIDRDQVAVVGHSGAGGYPGRGLNKVADQHGKLGDNKLLLFGIADTCITDINSAAYKKGFEGNDTTLIYSAHRGTGGWEPYSGSAKFAAALGAGQKFTAFTGNEKKEDIEDAFDNGGAKPARISIKVKKPQLASYHKAWVEAGGYRQAVSDHSDMVPYWVWTALPRFFAATEADKHLADAEPHEQKPPPKPAPVITGGEWADVPPAAPAWGDLPGAAPKPTGLAAFADPGSGLYWPVRAPKGHFGRAVCYIGADGKGYGPKGSGSCGRNFLANRPAGDPNPNRFHVGIDLFADFHDIIVACESGTIIQWKYFYTNVWKLMVQCDSGVVINYGEVDGSSLKKFNLQPGGRVVAGQPIAVAGKMLHDSMLHFEMYPKGTPDSLSYNKGLGDKFLKNYLNPTQYLLNLAKSGK